ncbi:MAG: DUF2975 domain-containing protein [Bacteroidetes bacterium]|nr:MAG: DUF2975 domain-containing protein [Bacteroidota bacterium]
MAFVLNFSAKTKAMFSAKTLSGGLYFVSAAATLISGIMTVGFFLLMAASLMGGLPRQLRVSLEIPVHLQKVQTFYEARALSDAYEQVRIEVEDARLKAVPAKGRWPQVLGYFIATIYTGMFALLFYQLQKILFTFKNDRPFTARNVDHIRRIGALAVGIVLFEFLIYSLGGILFGDQFVVEHGALTGRPFLERINWTTLFLGLIVLALSEVFRKGAVLQENDDLTV